MSVVLNLLIQEFGLQNFIGGSDIYIYVRGLGGTLVFTPVSNSSWQLLSLGCPALKYAAMNNA